MVTNAMLRPPEHTLLERAHGYSRPSKNEVVGESHIDGLPIAEWEYLVQWSKAIRRSSYTLFAMFIILIGCGANAVLISTGYAVMGPILTAGIAFGALGLMVTAMSALSHMLRVLGKRAANWEVPIEYRQESEIPVV